MENVRESDVRPQARKDLLNAAADHVITFPEFQRWLIRATKVDAGLQNTYAAEHYHKSIGSAPKSEDAVHSWNKHTMSQNLRRMQYAVRGEVVIRADASKCNGIPSKHASAFIAAHHFSNKVYHIIAQSFVSSGLRRKENHLYQHW